MKYNHSTALEHIVNNPKVLGINRKHIDFMLVEPNWYKSGTTAQNKMPDIIMRQSDLGFYVVELKSINTGNRRGAKKQIASGVNFIDEYFQWDYVNPIIAYYRASSIEHESLPFVFHDMGRRT